MTSSLIITILLIDELESVITLNDKVGVFNIIKDNNFNRWMPIIIITNNQHNKQLNEAKKYSNEIKIYPPYENEIVRWVNNICKCEKIMLEWNQITKFVEYCQNDMRKILIQLDELKINYGFYEFLSSNYAPYCLSGLLNLADFAQDSTLKSLAGAVVCLIRLTSPQCASAQMH